MANQSHRNAGIKGAKEVSGIFFTKIAEWDFRGNKWTAADGRIPNMVD